MLSILALRRHRAQLPTISPTYRDHEILTALVEAAVLASCSRSERQGAEAVSYQLTHDKTVLGGHKLAKHGDGNQRPMLASQIADQQVQVDAAVGCFRRSRLVLSVEIGEVARQKMGPLGSRGHVQEHPFPTADQARSLPDIGKSVHNRVVV